METQRGKTRIVAVVGVLAALSGLSLMAFAGVQVFYDGSLDYLEAGVPGTIVVPPATTAAAYIKFDGVDGEAQDTAHRSWSDLLSFSQGQSVPTDAFTGRAPGRVVFEDIVVTKEAGQGQSQAGGGRRQGQGLPHGRDPLGEVRSPAVPLKRTTPMSSRTCW